MRTRYFCSDASLAADEPLEGTAKHPDRQLLIRWPKGGWGRNLAIAQDMTPDLVAIIERVRAAGPRVNLIDRKGEATDESRLYLYPENLTCSVSRADLPGMLLRLLDGATVDWHPAMRPVMLVCTHGRKDRCCALRGHAMYRALRAAAQGVDLWESTHLGGCRLSAGALVLPGMHKYGRLVPADAAPLLAALERGQPWLPKWRGPCHLSPEAQVVAVSAARVGLVVAELENPAPGIWRASTQAATRWFATALQSVERPATCSDLDQGHMEPAEFYRVREIRDPAAIIF